MRLRAGCLKFMESLIGMSLSEGTRIANWNNAPIMIPTARLYMSRKREKSGAANIIPRLYTAAPKAGAENLRRE